MASFTDYITDRKFTNHVHSELAVPLVYRQIHWTEHPIDPKLLEYLDVNKGIDYLIIDSSGAIKTVQERFRESMYSNYSDFTIRYRRDHNYHEERVESEYYKMQAP